MNWEKISRAWQSGPITVFGVAVTVAGFALAAIVWINAGEVAGHTVSIPIPFTGWEFSVAFLLPVLSEGFVYMSVKIHASAEASESTKRIAKRSFVGALAIMSGVGLIVNTPLAEWAPTRALVSGVIGALTPVALLLAWNVRSRYTTDVQRYREALAAAASSTPSATRSKRRSSTSSATATSTKAASSAPSATEPANASSATTAPPESPVEVTAPTDVVDRAPQDATHAEAESGIRSLETYLAEHQQKTDQAAAYVKWLVLVNGRDLDSVTGAEVADNTDAKPALARRVVAQFKSGEQQITDQDRARLSAHEDPTATAN